MCQGGKKGDLVHFAVSLFADSGALLPVRMRQMRH